MKRIYSQVDACIDFARLHAIRCEIECADFQALRKIKRRMLRLLADSEREAAALFAPDDVFCVIEDSAILYREYASLLSLCINRMIELYEQQSEMCI